MGDFNARVCSNLSIIQGASGEVVFPRSVSDQNCGTVARSRGIDLVDSMNSVNMVIMNGIDSGGGFTFENKIGKSTIDLIMLSDNIVIPSNCIDPVNMRDIKASGNIPITDSIPSDSLYVHKSLTVWTDYKYRIGDHFLVTCKVVTDKPTLKIPFQKVGHNLDITRWVRRDRQNSKYWVRMQHELSKSLHNWDDKSRTTEVDIDSLVANFNSHVNDGLSRSLKISKNKTHRNRTINHDPKIFRLTCEENEAFYKYENANLSEKTETRVLWKKCKSKLKNAVRSIERKRRQTSMQKLEYLRSSNPREYWKGLYDLDNTSCNSSAIPQLVKNNEGKLVGGAEASRIWMESFSKLGLEKSDFGDYDAAFYVHIKEKVRRYQEESLDCKFELDYPITLEEVKKAVKGLKNGKAVGIDGIFNEVWKFGGDSVVQYLWKLYDQVFESEYFPVEWARGLIFPLFKGGPEDFKFDPAKYRGIALLSIVGKTYTSVLNARLSDYCEHKDIIVDEQAGFRRARSTVDQLFILKEVIVHRRPKPTYCAFIDIAKAYDKVWRDGLWYKLWKAGIRGKLWRILRNIYQKVESSVLLGDTRTDFFEIEVGVRQGCILSPILFTLFINDLRDHLDKLGKGVKWGNIRISLLYFADDIVLLADSKQDLEEMLQLVYEYSLKWRLKFNLDKCNVVVFQKKPREPLVYGSCVGKCSCANHFSFGPHLIKEVLYYKYLGMEFDYSLSFKVFKERILARARSSMARVWGMGIKSGLLSVKGSINLWQGLIRSNLEYGAQIWGKEKWTKGEQVQREMARRILRCSSYTTSEVLYGDLGWWTLLARRHYIKIMFYFHLASLDDERLLKKVFIVTKRVGKESSWVYSMKEILATYGLGHLWEDEKAIFNLDGSHNGEAKSLGAHKRFFQKYVRKKIHQQQEEEWWKSMTSGDLTRRKIRTYVTFKRKLCFEKYLLTEDSLGRSYHTSLRSGTNCLEIEKGRHEGVVKQSRLCKHCDRKEVEDELHFVTQCPLYNQFRENLFKSVLHVSGGKWDLKSKPAQEIFILLMQGTGDEYEKIVFRIFQCYLKRCFSRRKGGGSEI